MLFRILSTNAPFALLPLQIDCPSKTALNKLVQYDCPLIAFLPGLQRFTDSAGLMGPGQNKTTLTASNGLENCCSGLCVCVCMENVCVFTRSLQKLGKAAREKEQERPSAANGFPTGPSLTLTHSKKWQTIGEQELGNFIF